MATSGTYSFNPGLGDLVMYAFSLCGVSRTALTQPHMLDARMAANIMQADWLNKGVNLWQVELDSIPLVEGVNTYNLDPKTLVMLDSYVVTGPPFALVDRIIMPISRTEYASIPRKDKQGFPTVFWMERLLQPVVHIWPTPDGNESLLKFYSLRQAQDATFSGGMNMEVPYAWLKAVAYGLAAELAPIYALERAAGLVAAADRAYDAASRAGVETAQQYIAPQVGGYYRN